MRALRLAPLLAIFLVVAACGGMTAPPITSATGLALAEVLDNQQHAYTRGIKAGKALATGTLEQADFDAIDVKGKALDEGWRAAALSIATSAPDLEQRLATMRAARAEFDVAWSMHNGPN